MLNLETSGMFRTEHLLPQSLHFPKRAEGTQVGGAGGDPDSTNSCIGSGFLRSTTRSPYTKKLRSVAAAGLVGLDTAALHQMHGPNSRPFWERPGAP